MQMFEYEMNNNDPLIQVQSMLLDNKPIDALIFMNDYVSKHSYDANGYYWKGVAFLFLKKYSFAMTAFQNGEDLNPLDQDIMFGLGIANIALGNYESGKNYIEEFHRKYHPETNEVMGRASMLAYADLFLPAVTFIHISRKYKRNKGSGILFDFVDEVLKDYEDYALYKTPAMGNQRLLLDKVDVNNKHRMKEYIRQLVLDSYWKDALYFYWTFIKISCNIKCNVKFNKFGCFACMTTTVVGIKEFISKFYLPGDEIS
ncbi:MAG: hypothetical protein LHV68_04215 [Elusimicrobia bacterium]|nr:hypothetical protein [Candidatus Liberimonas magnetica]